MIKWQQLSKTHWLRDGDSNIRFAFYHQATNRRTVDNISRLRDEEEVWREAVNDIQGILLRYFRDIFASSNPPDSELNEVLSLVPLRVTPKLNQALSIPFTAAEVKTAIFSSYRNVLLAFELNHYLKSSRQSQGGCVALKIDMSKAYDRERGIRQGDPLSPYLFLFCAEAFTCLIQDVERRGRLNGEAVARHAPWISNLLFADDTLVFCEAIVEQIGEVGRILRTYARASGQEMNLQKSSIVVIGGCTGGKGVLVKAVLQALPALAMSCFQLLGGLIRELEASMADFWWHSRGQKRVHWVAWKKLCQSQALGGLDFRDLRLSI
ncbi:UNVERIFIED_CONTAM: putative mitochondrial protein [Sesamum latifolium]|uniref:Mitochondrial protein n=1 Tax=Sesamum latifolium TaxID=2727402 RepID=A0AAW2UK87_9LAMI